MAFDVSSIGVQFPCVLMGVSVANIQCSFELFSFLNSHSVGTLHRLVGMFAEFITELNIV